MTDADSQQVECIKQQKLQTFISVHCDKNIMSETCKFKKKTFCSFKLLAEDSLYRLNM